MCISKSYSYKSVSGQNGVGEERGGGGVDTCIDFFLGCNYIIYI